MKWFRKKINKHNQLFSIKNQDQNENQIMKLYTPLLLLIPLLRSTTHFNKVEVTQKKILAELNQIQQNLQNLDAYSKEEMLTAQYCICTALDEATLIDADESIQFWQKNSLLNILYQETWGGERFYILLNLMLKNPKERSDILELLYTLLSLGYKGKYYNDNPALNQLQQELAHEIKQCYPDEEFSYALPWKYYQPPIRLYKIFPLWVATLSFFILIVITDIGVNYLTIHKLRPTFSVLESTTAHLSQQLEKQNVKDSRV